MTTTQTTQTTTTHTVTGGHNGFQEREAICAEINDAAAAGFTVEVNGRPIFTRWGNAAHQFQNGSIEVAVQPRHKGTGPGSVWAKIGETMTVTVTA